MEAFESKYLEVYGRLLENIPVRLVTTKLAAIGRREKLAMDIFAPRGTEQGEPIEIRDVWFEGKTYATKIYKRSALPIGSIIDGPAILEQDDTTIVVEPDLKGSVDRWGNFIIERK